MTRTLTLVRDADEAPAVNPERVLQWFGSLSALGWPSQYVAEQCGHTGRISPALQNRNFSPEFTARVREWYEDHRDQEPTPRPGLTKEQIRKARNHSKGRRGWKTPDWYDDDGRLLGTREYRRRITAETKRRRALDQIEILRLIISYRDDEVTAARVGRSKSGIAKFRRAVGLTGTYPGCGVWLPDRKSRARLKEIERAIDAYLRDPDGDPHRTMHSLGIAQDRTLDRELERDDERMAS